MERQHRVEALHSATFRTRNPVSLGDSKQCLVRTGYCNAGCFRLAAHKVLFYVGAAACTNTSYLDPVTAIGSRKGSL